MSDKWKHDNWHMDECNRHKCGAKEIDSCPYCRITKLQARLEADADRRVNEAIGCTYATMCEIQLRSHFYGFPDGKDITQIEFPEIAESVIKALEVNDE
jgi:hypothetical protein